jgi:hypothetical protein
MKNRALNLILLIAFVVLPSVVLAGDFEGPLHIKNSHPLFLAMGSPELLSAKTGNSASVGLTYASTYMPDRSQAWSFGVDLETAVLDLRLKKVLANGLEVSIDLPLISNNSGVLDGPLASYHNAFGFPDYGRSERPKNEFLFQVTRNGKTVIQGENGGISLGDIRLGIKKELYSGGPLISLQGFVNLPTGDPDTGYGSGRVNGGASVLLNKALNSTVMAYFNAGFGIIDTLAAQESVKLKNYLYGGAGVEWALSGKWRLNAQFFAQQSPLRTTGVRDIDTTSSLLSLGGRYRVGKQSAIGISLTEDPSTAGAPDFMVALDYTYHF